MNDLINYNNEIVAIDNQDIPFDYLRPHEAISRLSPIPI
jgi:hypothetical protein